MNRNQESINCMHALALDIKILEDRRAFIVDYCSGKNALHIGCVGSGIVAEKLKNKTHLHYRLNQVCKALIGIDINKEGIRALHKAGFVDCFPLDIENECVDHEIINDVDVIVVPEVIEHLSNPGKFLDNLKKLHFTGDILISVPNAFSYRLATLIKNNSIEFVHPDHNYYFSSTTLKMLLMKHGFSTVQQILYYWPSDDPFGKEFKQVLSQCPYFAEGIISIARDNRNTRKKNNDTESIQKGEILAERGEYGKAEQIFLKLLQQDPHNVHAYNNLGTIAYLQNDTAKAIEFFTKALRIDPYYKDAILNFTDILRKFNILSKAIPYLENAVNKYPDDMELKGVLNVAKKSLHTPAIAKGQKVIPWKIYYSPGVSHHGEKIRNLLNIEHYIPSIHAHEPVWFFGMYFDSDYKQISAHDGKKIINWRGSDALQLINNSQRIKIIQKLKALHVCQSHRQQRILTELGIKSIIRPMITTPVNSIIMTEFPTDKTNILVFWRRGIDEFIRADLFFEIASRCPDVSFHIVGDEDPSRFDQPGMENLTFHGFINEEQLDHLMDQCKGTIRPWVSDGTPNIQTKMLLKGRYVAHSCKFEKAAQCATAEDYINWLNNLKKINKPNIEAREWWMKHLNNFDFLKIDFKPRY